MPWEIKHGLSKNRLFSIWAAMMSRCYNQNCRGYRNYGARGIDVCERWHDPRNFIADMTEGSGKGLTIDRIDNNKGYSPENCRWVTQKANCNNQRKTVKYTYKGETHSLPEWEEITGISQKTLRHRLTVFKWTPEQAFETPVMSRADLCKKGRDARDTMKITYNGETHSLPEWSRITGIPYDILRVRLVTLQWTPEEILTTPVASRLDALAKANEANAKKRIKP